MKTLRKKWVIGSTTTIIILALLFVIIGPPLMAKIAPKEYVLLSLLKAEKEWSKTSKYTQIMKAKNKKTWLDLNIKEITGLDPYYKDVIGGLGISLSAASHESQEVIIDANLNKHGGNLVDLSLYSSRDHFGVKIPGLLDQYVMVNLNEFKENYDQTKLSAFLGPISVEEVNNFKNSLDQGKKLVTGEQVTSYEALGHNYKESLELLIKTMDVTFTGTTTVEIGQTKEKANIFSIHLDPKDMIHFEKEIVRATFKNDYIAENLELASQIFGEDMTAAKIQDLVLDYLSLTNMENIQVNLTINNKRQILETEIMASIKSGKAYDLYLKQGPLQDLLFVLVEDNVELFKADLQVKKDFETEDYKRSLIADISLAQNPNIKINFSGDFLVENLKDRPLTMGDEQKLDFFSLGPSQMLDLVFRLGTHFYQLSNGLAS